MKLYMICLLIVCYVDNSRAVVTVAQNSPNDTGEDPQNVAQSREEFPSDSGSSSRPNIASSARPEIKETIKDNCSQDLNDNIFTTSRDEGVLETHQNVYKNSCETCVRKVYSSQQATELLVSSWNDITTWTKRNESSSLCERDVERIILGYLNNEYWALQFFDAWTKPGPSLLHGRSMFVGNYRQCRESKSPEQDNGRGFLGNYCVVTLKNLTYVLAPGSFTVAALMKADLGTCLPSTCSGSDVTELFRERIQALNISSLFKVAFTDCRSEEREFTTFTRVAIAIVVIIGALCVIGTTIDVIRNYLLKRTSPNQDQQYKKTDGDHTIYNSKTAEVGKDGLRLEKFMGFSEDVLLAFSVRTNWHKLTHIAPGSITVISGIRFLLMSWILLGHTFYFMVYVYGSNANQGLAALTESRLFDFVFHMFFGVDAFFAISGFLVSYHWIKTIMEKGWKINWAYFYFHRYWRLTPPYIGVLILIQGLQRFMVSGAMAPSSQPVDKINCQNNWWLHALYANNIFRFQPTEFCLSHSWSLAVDMQFYIVSPLMLVPFYYHKYAGIASCLIFAVVQFLIAGFRAYNGAWGIGMSLHEDWWPSYYINFYTRISPFAFGILAGYILSVNGGRIKLRPYQVAIGWILAAVVGFWIIFGFRGDLSGDRPSGPLSSAMYHGVSKGLWGACILWVIVACTSGYGGPVNAVLSWPPFCVLGRVTYIAYMIQMSIFTIIFENLEQPIFINYAALFVFAAAGLFFTCIVSAVLTICLEFPMLNLERAILGPVKH